MSDNTTRIDVGPQLRDRPEVPTTAHWRMAMRQARESRGISQADLGRRVGVSQNVISKIESGQQESSEFVVAICKELSIALPFALFTDDLDERWFQAGQLMRKKDERMFRGQVLAMEALAKSLMDDEGHDA
jgi:transcriptional regulator with XRE-family HTH domain